MFKPVHLLLLFIFLGKSVSRPLAHVRKLQHRHLKQIQSFDIPAFIRIDPPSCDVCHSLDNFWNLVGEKRYPSRVWILDCDEEQTACKELGAAWNVDVRGSLIEAWTGYTFERFIGKKNLQSLQKWLDSVEDGTLAKELAKERSKPPRNLKTLPSLGSVSLLNALRNAEDTQRQLLDEGVVYLSNVLQDAKLTFALSKWINVTLIKSIEAVETGKFNETQAFGRVLERKHRFDLKLPLSDLSTDVSKAISTIITALQPLVENLLGGERAELFDLSAVVSDPGSAEQPLHFDQQWTTDVSVLSFFVALEDITCNMGPTVFQTKSNSEKHHNMGIDHVMKSTMSHVALLNRGDAVLFDARVFHQGSANRSEKRRTMFYISFKSTYKNGSVSSTSSVLGTGSLLKSVADRRFTLGELSRRQIWNTDDEINGRINGRLTINEM